jgi:hypothetical protein
VNADRGATRSERQRNDSCTRDASATIVCKTTDPVACGTRQSLAMANGRHTQRSGLASISGIAVAMPLVVTTGCFLTDDGYDGDDTTPAADDGDVPEPEPQPEPLQEEPFTEPCVPDAWIEAADATEGTGVPTSFDLHGSQLNAVGAATVQGVPAPWSIVPSPNGADPLVVIEDATVDGEAVGTVVIVGAAIEAETGDLVELAPTSTVFGADAVQLSLAVADDDGTRPQLGATADPAHVASLADAEPVDLRLDAVRIAAYTSAYVVTPDGNVALAGPFEISASRVYWPHGTVLQAPAVEARVAGDVVIGLEPISGDLEAQGELGNELPLAIFGRDAHLVVGPRQVRTIEDMPVHQAMGRADVLLASEVELRMCQAPTLVFHAGQTRILRLAYRQPGGTTDAVFQSTVLVTDANGAEWTARIDVDGTLPAALTSAAEQHPDTSWGSALVDFAQAWADAIETITKGLVCVFTLGFLCPDDDEPSTPTPLLAYPAWMEAGELGEFELELAAPATAGTYDVTVTITGDNYEANVPVTVVVQ